MTKEELAKKLVKIAGTKKILAAIDKEEVVKSLGKKELLKALSGEDIVAAVLRDEQLMKMLLANLKPAQKRKLLGATSRN
jgi:hypothetical protein